MDDKTFILNFGHKLSPRVLAHLAPCEEVMFLFEANFKEQTATTVEKFLDGVDCYLEKNFSIHLDGAVPLVFVFPSLSEYTAVLVAALHGRLGQFPRILSLRKSQNNTWTLFADSAGLGIIDLDGVRKEGRRRRNAGKKAVDSEV